LLSSPESVAPPAAPSSPASTLEPPDEDPDDEDPPPLEPLFAVTEASLCDPVGCDPEGDPKSFVAPPFAHAAASAEAIAIPPQHSPSATPRCPRTPVHP